MSLKDLYTTLEALENGAEFVAQIKKEVATLSNEAKTHREAKEKAEADLLELQGKLEQEKSTSTSKQTKLQALETQVNMLTKKYEEAEKARQLEQEKRVQTDIKAQVIDALTKGNAMDANELATLHIGNVKVNDAGEYVYQTSNGEVSIADGVNGWLKSHAWAVKDTQKQGSGAGTSGSSGTTITKDKFKKMGYEEREKLFLTDPDTYNQLKGD